MAQKPHVSNSNMLFELYTSLFNSSIEIRNRICTQCNWSLPTFYRKMKIDSPKEKPEEMSQFPFSNAEKEMIITLFDALLTEISQQAQKYRK